MKLEYPIVITKDNKDYIVYVPDLDINTSGKTFEKAMSMAYDAIGEVYIVREDYKMKINKPSSIEKISNQAKYKNDIVTSISIDTKAFRMKNDAKAVRRNITLPSWLDKIIRKKHLNVSEFLQNALIDTYDLNYV